MAPDPRPSDGDPHGALFARFPDPILAYGPGTDESDRDADGDEATGLVVSAVNPAFETTFGVAAGEVVGAPLAETTLAGAIEPGGPVGSTAGEEEDESGDADRPAPPTAGALVERVRARDGGVVRLRRDVDDGTRHFRVREVTAADGAAGAGGGAGATDGREGYLLFADVTREERRRRELAATLARVERLASVASHDLRNPLEVARIRLEAARDTGEAVHFEKVAGALDRIEEIVRDVLSVGGGVDPTDAVALGDVAAAAWETVDTADASLVVAPTLPTVRGDADRVRQLFENLVRNAVEHGGPEVTVTVEPLPDGFVVADDGPGFSPEARERALEPGFSTAPDNSGLGLAIVARVAAGHGWEVTLGNRDRDPDGSEVGDGESGGTRIAFTGVERVENGDCC